MVNIITIAVKGKSYFSLVKNVCNKKNKKMLKTGSYFNTYRIHNKQESCSILNFPIFSI